MTPEPVVIEPTLMKSSGDCSICCLKMLLGVSYPEIIAAIPKKLQKTVHHDGLNVQQCINVGRRLGFTLEYHHEPEDDEVGVLSLERIDGGHDVMWMRGVIYNQADGELWTDDDAFLARRQWTVVGFLKRIQEEQ